MKKIITALGFFLLFNVYSASAAETWQMLPSHSDVPLDKEWNISFNQVVKSEKIDGIVIEYENEFIPISVKLDQSKNVKVSAKNGFYPNSKYTMRIFLSNGKKYKMDFTTTSGYRNIDVDNDVYISSPEIKLNEKINASLVSDTIDFFKIEIPEDGILSVKAIEQTGNDIDLAIYGEKGNSESAIVYDNYVTTAEVSAPLTAGTYYIRVQPQGRTAGDYTLQTTFKKTTLANDRSANTYVQAPSLKLNSTTTGHLGFIAPTKVKHNLDFYKIEIPVHGVLNIQAQEQNGHELDVALYGKKGDDENAIIYDNYTSQAILSKPLAPGTYYIRLTAHEVLGSEYKLSTQFTPIDVQNDEAAANYITAPAINLNQTYTGLLGYTDETKAINYNDYYKIIIPTAGTLSIAAEKNGGKFHVKLYGERGDDQSSLTYASYVQSAHLTYQVKPGTYYVKLENEDNAGAYKFTATLK